MLCFTGGFPVNLDLLDFTGDEHILTVTATDSAGQPSSHEYTFFGIPDLELTCAYNETTNSLNCSGNNQLVSPICSFDGQEPFQCSFPLEIRLTGLRLGQHTVTLTASDEFGQMESILFTFDFALGPIVASIPSRASVIEGKLISPVLFRISGQTLTTFPFSLSPLTYSQFEAETGVSVHTVFDRVPREASLGRPALSYSLQDSSLFFPPLCR